MFLMALWFCLSCSTSQNKSIPGPTDDPNYTFTSDGAWCWFSDPRALYFEGKHKRTYSGWVDSKGSIVVGAYDHEHQTIETSTIHMELQIDDHNNPSLLMDSEGKLMVFYSKHSDNSPILLSRGKYPENIQEWETAQPLELNDTSLFEETSNTYTYTNIVRLSEESNKLYLFWRGTDFKPNFSTSEDGGRTWSKGKILVLPERIYRNRRPYLKIATDNYTTIHLAFTDGHPRNEPTNSIYYAKYKDQGLYKADGSAIKPWADLPLDPLESDLVYDASTTGEKAWIWDVAGDSEGNPVIVYSRFPNDSTHLYYYAVWKNGGWDNIKLVNSGGWFPQTQGDEVEREPNYSGGIALDHSNPSIAYLSIEKNGIFEIEKWETDDNGQNWISTEITQNSIFSNIRPFVVRNRPSEYSTMVLWMNFRNYVHYTNYDSSIKISIQ
jgi:hypothetical protein